MERHSMTTRSPDSAQTFSWEEEDLSPDEGALLVPFEIGSKPRAPDSPLPPAQAQVLCIASGKGGTGKTTFTTNLAIALAKEGLKVLIVDGDFGLANDHLLLGLELKGDIRDVITGRRPIREVLLQGPEGITLLPGGSGDSDLSTLADFEIRSLSRDIGCLEPEFDIILIDLAAGISPQIMRFLRPAHEIILVTNPEVTALLDAYGLIKSISAWNPGKEIEIQVVENRVKTREEAVGSMKRLRRVAGKYLENLHLSFLAYIPYDRYLLHSIAIQEPVVLSHPRSFVTACLTGIAQKLKGRYRGWDERQHGEHPQPSYFAQLERQHYD